MGLYHSVSEEPKSNSYKGILYIPRSSRIGALPSNGLVSSPGHSLGGSLTAKMQSVYSTAQADWAKSDRVSRNHFKHNYTVSNILIYN